MKNCSRVYLSIIMTFYMLIISACAKSMDLASIKPTPTINITPIIISTQIQHPPLSPTPIPSRTPTETLFSTFTPPAPANADLPTGWEIREAFQEMGDLPDIFQVDLNSRYKSGYGWSFSEKELEFNSHILSVKDYDSDNDLVEIFLDHSKIMTLNCANENGVFGKNIISLLAYENHWVVEILCNTTSNIIFDGQMLNETNHYSSSFSPYIFSGKLFFFFYRNEEVGFYYAGDEFLLNYEAILYNYCCASSDLNPEFYTNAIRFFAIRGGNGVPDDRYNYRYEVIMGIPIT